MEQMDLINDDEANKIRVGSLRGLAGDDVVLLRGRNDDLGLGNLLLGEL